MDTQNFYDRKQYIEQVRGSFSDDGTDCRYPACQEQADPEKEGRSFFRLRLAVSAACFLTFLFIQQTDFTFQGMSAESIVKQIEKSVSLPDSMPDLLKLIRMEE